MFFLKSPLMFTGKIMSIDMFINLFAYKVFIDFAWDAKQRYWSVIFR